MHAHFNYMGTINIWWEVKKTGVANTAAFLGKNL